MIELEIIAIPYKPLFDICYVGEGPWWPIKSFKKGRKRKAYKRERERERERDQIKSVDL